MPSHRKPDPSSSSSSMSVVQAQLDSLDDTDCYASVWEDILSKQQQTDGTSGSSLWGGKGKGGRGLSRRTLQPHDVVVEDVRLQYLRGGDPCLEGATLKLLRGHAYALCGTNGCGKSTLLRRMHARRIPGWSTQWTSLLLPPELPPEMLGLDAKGVLAAYKEELSSHAREAVEARMDRIQEKIDALDAEEEPDEMERLCEELSVLDEELEEIDSSQGLGPSGMIPLFAEMGVHELERPCQELSKGQQKQVLLAVAMALGPDAHLLLLDEPTAHLDVFGLIQLRRVLEACAGRNVVVLVSHDVDFVNDAGAATDVIEMRSQKLWYYPGNYDNYVLLKEQQGMHELRTSVALEKKRGQLLTTLQHLKEKPVPKRGGAKKKAKAVASQRKKLERHQQLEKSVAASSVSSSLPAKKGLTAQQRLKLAETLQKVPDKAVQFVFPNTSCRWGGPLITALEVGFGYNVENPEALPNDAVITDDGSEGFRIVKKEGVLFDCLDLCINEGSRNCILGPTASGKSTLMKVLAKKLVPLEGTVHHASGVRVGYLDAGVLEDTVGAVGEDTTALAHLAGLHPTRTEEDARAHLTAFGLSPTKQAKTPIRFLSSGETFRFVLATITFEKPPILCLDDPTRFLDVESVQSLIHGLQQWNGTLLLVSSDANFLRTLGDVHCAVLMPDEGKLRRVDGGMDAYLKSFRI